jgi:hypothetical protein
MRNIKERIADQLIGAVKLAGERVVAWWFTEQRGLQARERDRVRWWNWHCKALASKTKADDCVAAYLKARFNFHDSPDVKDNKERMAKLGLGHFGETG